jgi:hypothetical protein
VKEATAAAKKRYWYETRPAVSHSSRYPTEKIRQKDRYGNQRLFETDDEAHQFPSSLRILLLYLLCKGDCTRKQNFVAADHTLNIHKSGRWEGRERDGYRRVRKMKLSRTQILLQFLHSHLSEHNKGLQSCCSLLLLLEKTLRHLTRKGKNSSREEEEDFMDY